jgi:hypothetical protein
VAPARDEYPTSRRPSRLRLPGPLPRNGCSDRGSCGSIFNNHAPADPKVRHASDCSPHALSLV